MVTQVLFYFLIYGFLGWCAEVAFAALCSGKFVNRGFLMGPICPIYGFGMLCVIGLLSPVENNLILLFLGSVILTSAMEFITGYLLEKLFNQKWWDYSNIPFNIKGYICPLYSLVWGFACVFIMKLIHPGIRALVNFLPEYIRIIILSVIFVILAVDCVMTLFGILKIKKHYAKIEEMEQAIRWISEQIGGKISDRVLLVKNKTPEIEEKISELAEKYSTAVSQAKKIRLLKAFPSLKKKEPLEKIKKIINDLKDEKNK